MSAVLSRFPLKVQIGSLVALAGLILGLALVVLWTGQGTSGTAADRAAVEGVVGEKAGLLDRTLLDARRREKDFLLRKEAKYVAEHAQSMTIATTALDTMAAAMGDGDPRRSQVDTVRKGVAVYTNRFAKLAEQQNRVGLNETQGLMGALRGSVHEVETILKSHDELRLAVLMLMMRRHEKDFLLRSDEARVQKQAQAVAAAAAAVERLLAELSKVSYPGLDFSHLYVKGG